MRWWMMPLERHDKTMSIDNDFVVGMNFSTLAPNIRLIEWREGRGEIEFIGRPQLRTNFYDITPYTPFFQQFMILTPGISLVQAKKIQIDLIKQLFETKRQLPLQHAVAAGNYWWDASDAAVAAMSAATLPSLLGGTSGTGNSLITQINTQNADMVSKINTQNSTEVSKINSQNVSVINQTNTQAGNLANSVTTNVVNPGASATAWLQSLADQINTRFYNMSNEINGNVVPPGNSLINFLNETVLGAAGAGGSPGATNTINDRLQGSPVFGLSADITHFFIGFTNVSYTSVAVSPAAYGTPSTPAITASPITTTPITASPITPGSGPGAATLQWTPLGQANPVTVTVTEISDIMSLISNRRTSLLTVKTNKTNAVNALTTVGDVIAYDVLAGWPVIPLPPGGYVPDALVLATSATIVGTPVVSEGVPEAPSTGITYGRRNMVWNPALALTGDVLDGGNF